MLTSHHSLVLIDWSLISYKIDCRHELYAGYKGQRPPTPEPISEALKQLRDLLRVMAIPEIVVPGIEADDVIGTISNRALDQGFQVAVVSPDKVIPIHVTSPCLQTLTLATRRPFAQVPIPT